MGPHGLLRLLEFRASEDRHLLTEYKPLVTPPAQTTRARDWLLRRIAAMGLEGSVHQFEGQTNVICALRANRGDGKEALVLSSRCIASALRGWQ